MERYIIDRMRITTEDLQALAQQRARAIEQALVRRGIEAHRLYLATERGGALQADGAGRVEFQLLF